MILIPAIDISAGKAVRLEMGAFGSETVYDADPLARRQALGRGRGARAARRRSGRRAQR